MTRTEALNALREGKMLTADWPDSDTGVIAAHLIPEGERVRWRRYLGEGEWMPNKMLTWAELEAWAPEKWQEWGL